MLINATLADVTSPSGGVLHADYDACNKSTADEVYLTGLRLSEGNKHLMSHAHILSFQSISIRAATERSRLPPLPPCPRMSDAKMRRLKALQLGNMWHSLHTSEALSLRREYHGISVHIDVDSEGGPWALVEVGRSHGTNLRTTAAVNGPPLPLSSEPGLSAKLSRQDMVKLYAVSGTTGLKWGDPSKGYLYARNLPRRCLSIDGCDNLTRSSGFGSRAEWGANRVSTSVAGQTYSGSRFQWPADYPPSACINSEGGSAECGGGYAVGTWRLNGIKNDPDEIYYRGGTTSARGYSPYEVWVKIAPPSTSPPPPPLPLPPPLPSSTPPLALLPLHRHPRHRRTTPRRS